MNNNNSNQSEGGKEDLNELTKSLKVMKSLSTHLSFCCLNRKIIGTELVLIGLDDSWFCRARQKS